MKPEQINRKLLWDYDWDESEFETEEFERWYIQRVLTRGCSADVEKLGIEKIRGYWRKVPLPKHVRHYWQWFFSRAEVECIS